MADPAASSPAPAPTTDQDPRGLHDLAVDAQTDIQKLATGLAHAGANPQAVAQITHMAEILSEIVKVLGEGPALTPTTPGQVQPQGAPVPQGPPQPPGPPGPPQPGAPPAEAHNTLHAATHALHAAMIASKSAAAQQPK